MRREESQARETYTTSDAEAGAEDGDKEGDGDEYARDDVAEPVDLIYGYTKLGGSWTRAWTLCKQKGDMKMIPSVDIGPNQAHGMPVTKPKRT